MKKINLLIISFFVLLSTVANAHTGIKSTFPQNGAKLEQAPEAIELNFKGVVQLMQLQLKTSPTIKNINL